MKTQGKVNRRLFKKQVSDTKKELEGERVELGVIQEGMKATFSLNEYTAKINKLKKELKEYKSLEAEMESNKSKGASDYKVVVGKLDEVEKMGRQLGIATLDEQKIMGKALADFRKAIN